MSTQSVAGRDGFVFDVHAPLVVFSDQDLLEGLKRYAAVHGMRPFRWQDFRAWKERPFDPQTVTKRFGSWRKALALIGIENARARRADPAELIANLAEVWRRMGRRPGCVQLRKRGRFSAGVYRRRFGSVRRACELLAACQRGEITRETLLAEGARERTVRTAVRASVRWKVLKRDGFGCLACGQSPKTHPGVDLEVDHIVPASKGGTDEESNLRTLCRRCNRGKRDGE
jgi:hypothetical protein